MDSFNLTKEMDLLIFDLHGQAAMLDTGSPFSLARAPFTLDGRYFNINQRNQFADIHTIAQPLGINLDIFIGISIISQFDIRVRWDEGEIDIGEEITPYLIEKPLILLMNSFPSFQIAISDNDMTAFLDTGAHISYIDPAFVRNRNSHRHASDYNPIFGFFETDIYNLETIIDFENTINMEYGVLPTQLYQASIYQLKQMYSIPVIMGTELFRNYNCCISWRNQRISFSPL